MLEISALYKALEKISAEKPTPNLDSALGHLLAAKEKLSQDLSMQEEEQKQSVAPKTPYGPPKFPKKKFESS